MTDTVGKAIREGDVEALRALVAADPKSAHEPIGLEHGSPHRLPPLHVVCDAVFGRFVDQERARALAEVLLGAGVDPDLDYAESGDTFLIAAASLGAESVGLVLLDAGADVARRGLFGATALHWAALMGLSELGARLVDAGADLGLADEKYDCTPLEWALHAWHEGTHGDRDRLPAVARLLVERGAAVDPGRLERLTGPEHAAMRAALSRP